MIQRRGGKGVYAEYDMARSHIYIRPLDPQNPADIFAAEKAMTDSGNYFPEGAFRLPSTQIMLAIKDGKVIAVQPFYRSLVMGSLAFSDGLSDTDKASAMHQFTAAAFTDIHRFGLLDGVLFSDTDATLAFSQRHGFSEPKHKALVLEVR